jgi:hypothetical protein
MLIHGLFYTGSKTNKNLFNRQTHCILPFKSGCLLKTKPTLKITAPGLHECRPGAVINRLLALFFYVQIGNRTGDHFRSKREALG